MRKAARSDVKWMRVLRRVTSGTFKYCSANSFARLSALPFGSRATSQNAVSSQCTSCRPAAGTGVSRFTRLTDKGDFRGCLGRHEGKEFFGSQHGLVLRRPLYFFNDYHIDECLG